MAREIVLGSMQEIVGLGRSNETNQVGGRGRRSPVGTSRQRDLSLAIWIVSPLTFPISQLHRIAHFA